MGHSYRDTKQRFHRGRQGAMLVPHAALSGLLFTVNPRQDHRAVREAQHYLAGLVEDLCAAHQAYVAAGSTAGDSLAGAEAGPHGEGEKRAGPAVAPSTSSLLAAELAAVMGGSRKRPRASSSSSSSSSDDDDTSWDGEDREEGGGSSTGRRRRGRGAGARAKPALGQTWFASLETYCKGYMLLNVPAVHPAVTCVVCRAGGESGGGAREGEAGPKAAAPDANTPDALVGERGGGEGSGSALPPHSIVINPLVSHVVERIFADMTGANARPVFRHCFRLTPVELTCCPTLPEMQLAVKSLLALHFPSAEAGGVGPGRGPALDLTFQTPIPVADVGAGGRDAGEPAKKTFMHTIVLHLNVKNNTNVEAKKGQLQSQLQSAIPMNRFIVLQPSLLQKAAANKVNVDAVLCVNVLHATCTMGMQRLYAARRGYNLHDLSEERLELSDSVTMAKAAPAS